MPRKYRLRDWENWDDRKIGDPNAKWHSDPATVHQYRRLAFFQVKHPPNLTKGLAADFIDTIEPTLEQLDDYQAWKRAGEPNIKEWHAAKLLLPARNGNHPVTPNVTASNRPRAIPAPARPKNSLITFLLITAAAAGSMYMAWPAIVAFWFSSFGYPSAPSSPAPVPARTPAPSVAESPLPTLPPSRVPAMHGTLISPVTKKVPFGEITIQPGTRVEIINDAETELTIRAGLETFVIHPSQITRPAQK